MDIRKEILDFSTDADKPVLLWLFDKYNMWSEWRFVAAPQFERYGQYSFQITRIWHPTEEGYILYQHFARKRIIDNLSVIKYAADTEESRELLNAKLSEMVEQDDQL